MPNHVTNWSPQEDKKLTSLISEKGNNDWSSIADQIQTKTPQQCKIRWTKHLNPKLNKEWTAEQKRELFKLHKQHSNRWTDISRQLPRRCDVDVKNTFYNFFRKGLRKIGKLIGTPNSTQQVRQMKPKQISRILKEYIEKYQNDFIYNVVLECAIDSENKDFEMCQPKHYSREQIENLKQIYSMFLKGEVKIVKKLNRSSNKSLSISKLKNKKEQFQEQTKLRQQIMQKKEKKIDTKLKKRQSKKIFQNETIVQNSFSEQPLQQFQKPRKLLKRQEIKQKVIPKIEEKQKPKQQQKVIQKKQQNIRLSIENLIIKNRSRDLSIFNKIIQEANEKQIRQKDPLESSNRNNVTSSSRTRSMTAMIQASGRHSLFKDVIVSQQEEREINGQIFPSGMNDL